MKKRIKIIIVSIFTFFLSAVTAFANGWEMETNWPDSPVGTKLSAETNISELVAYFYEWGITIGIILFFGIIVFSGIKMIASTGDPSKYNKAKEGLKSSSLGVLVLLSSFLILNTINPDLTEIEKIEPINLDSSIRELQSAPYSGDTLCDFAFVTTQKKDESKENTKLMIPGMSIKTNPPIFPVKSVACIPEKDESKFREVRENDKEEQYMLVESISGKEVKDENYERVNYGESDIEKLKDLYRLRYKKVREKKIKNENQENQEESEEVLVDKEFKVSNNDKIHDYLLLLKERERYNIFEDCKKMTAYPQFNRPRCLEIEEENNHLKITEWKKIGYASLIEAMEVINNLGTDNLDRETRCPTSTKMKGNLGYKESSSGSGCNLSFYDGITRDFWSGAETITCDNKISTPSANMIHFDGIVDRPSNCMTLSRNDPPLDDLEEIKSIKKPLTVKITINRENITTEEDKDGYVYICKGLQKNSEDRDIYSCNDYKIKGGIHPHVKVDRGEHTLVIQGEGQENLAFEDTTDCKEKGDINDGSILNSQDRNCLIDIQKEREFVLIKDNPNLHTITFQEKNSLEGVDIEINGSDTLTTNNDGKSKTDLTDGDYTFSATLEGYDNYSDNFLVDGNNETINFQMDIKEYQVEFTDYDGSLIETRTVEHGEEAEEPADNPERSGYEFIGWDWESNEYEEITKDLSVEAMYKKEDESVITFQEKNSLEGVDIEIFEMKSESAGLSISKGKTDIDGKLSKNLEDADYFFKASLKGYDDHEEFFEVEGSDETIKFEMIAQEHTVTLKEINKKENVIIKIYDDKNRNNEIENGITDSDGEMDTSLKTGDYWFIASCFNCKEEKGSFYINENETIEFEMIIEYEIKFIEERLIDDPPSSLYTNDVSVKIYSDQNRNDKVKETKIDSSGKVSETIPAGDYWLTASHDTEELYDDGKNIGRNIYEDYEDKFTLNENKEVKFKFDLYSIILSDPETRETDVGNHENCNQICSNKAPGLMPSCESIGTDPEGVNGYYYRRGFWGNCIHEQESCSKNLGKPISLFEIKCAELKVDWTHCRCKIE